MAHSDGPADRDDDRTTTDCPTCRGTGRVTTGEKLVRGDGTGRVAPRKGPCPDCEGSGERTARQTPATTAPSRR